jgi:putative DNA primase/helicase
MSTPSRKAPAPAPAPALAHDGKLTVATGRSRKETAWRNGEMLWSELVEKLSQTTRTRETLAEYNKMSKSQQDEIKDVGGFIGGALKGGRRTAQNVAWRQVITLDADFADATLWDTFTLLYDCAGLIYSTHKHRPEKQRLRLCLPLSRSVTPDEYQAIARRIAGDIGIDLFDDTTYQPHRLMYWPSTSSDGEFRFELQDGPWLDADAMLARYEDWQDQTLWPVSSRITEQHQKMAEKQGDPTTKPGLVGAFCRVYDIHQAIEAFLPDVYQQLDETRYTYLAGSTAGGLVVYDGGKFAFSHHGTDPVSGRLVNAFDLVRLHKFSSKDEDVSPSTPTIKLPSYLAMLDLAGADERVKVELGAERLARAAEDFGDVVQEDRSWMSKLEYTQKGSIKATRHNLVVILENDPRIAAQVAYNEFTGRPVAIGDLPWRKVPESDDGSPWSDNDDAALRHFMESEYGIESANKISDALAIVSERHRFHPIRDYLDSLWWDGLERLDSLLIDYLGAEDCAYTRAVTRKALAAAVARIYRPGTKFDYMLVLVGQQGEGKSYIINKLGQRWYSDSFTTVQGKEAYEQLQGAWLLEMGELAAAKKAEVEAIKHFISKAEDNYRVAYGRRVSRFPRQCVFFGTTNEIAFLRDKSGNRRFWPVEVDRSQATKSLWVDMTQYEIDQIWAEALDAWRSGEQLYLGPDLEQEAILRQEQHTEESSKAGLVREYLDTLLPADWEDRDLATRRLWLHNRELGDAEDGSIQRDRVCVMEIWSELFQGDPKQLSFLQAREIHDILRSTKGWRPYNEGSGRLRFGKIYGLQKAYIRVQ